MFAGLFALAVFEVVLVAFAGFAFVVVVEFVTVVELPLAAVLVVLVVFVVVTVFAAVFVVFVVFALFALVAVLFAGAASPHAKLSAASAKTDESAIAFFISKSKLLSSSKNKSIYFF